MYATDLLLLATAALASLRPLTPWRRSRAVTVLLAAPAVAAMVLHVAAGLPRWQLTPVYVVVGLAVVAAVLVLADRSEPVSGRGAGAIGVTLVVVGAALTWALPLPVLDPPAGPYAVGTTTTVVVDPDRSELYGTAPGGPRRLVAQVFYPARPEPDAPAAPLVTGARAFTTTVAGELGLPRFALDHLDDVTVDAVEDAPPAGGAGRDVDGEPRLPVVVLSHGWTGFRTAQVGLSVALASHGYVVVAIDHTHGSMATVFPDGEVVPHDPKALPEGVDPAVYDRAAEQLVATFAADIAATLDHLDAGGVPLLDGLLDLERTATLGHSTGGGAAVLHCATDPRCATVVGYDPWVEPVPDRIVGDGLAVPLLSLRSEEWAAYDNDARLRRLHAVSTGPEGRVEVLGTLHRDVTVLPLLTPLAARLGLIGETPPDRTHAIVEEWTRRFLDHHLLGLGADPLRAPPRHDEAVLEVARSRPAG